MARLNRFAVSLLSVMAFAAFGAGAAAAQDAPVRVADAQAFMGNWAVALDAQGQTFVLNVDITDESGNVAAAMSNDMAPAPSKATRVAKNGENLVLNFSMDAQGQTFPVVVTLTPDAGALNANVDFADGMFTATGKGTKR